MNQPAHANPVTRPKSPSRAPWPGRFAPRGMRSLLFVGTVMTGVFGAFLTLSAMGNGFGAAVAVFAFPWGIWGLIPTPTDAVSSYLRVAGMWAFPFIYWSIALAGILTSKRWAFVFLFLFFAVLSVENAVGSVVSLKAISLRDVVPCLLC